MQSPWCCGSERRASTIVFNEAPGLRTVRIHWQRRRGSGTHGGYAMPGPLEHPDAFVTRHIGPDDEDVEVMLREVGAGSLDELIDQTVPASIRIGRPLDLP